MDIDILTFCASHLSSEKRVAFLVNAINSIMNQKHKTCLFVSVSFENSELVKSLVRYPRDNLKIFFHANNKLSQFEHYDFLVQQIDPLFINRTWVMFMDDDDYSHSMRSLWYHVYTKFKSRSCMSVINPYVVYYRTKSDEPVDNDKCCEALDTGKAYVFSSREHVAYCVRLRLLVDFLAVVKAHKLLKTHMCDVAFSSVLYHLTLPDDWTAKARWMYVYFQHGDADRSSRVYDDRYYMRTYKRKFFDDLADQFNIIGWEHCPGYTPIFGKKAYARRGWFWWIYDIPTKLLMLSSSCFNAMLSCFNAL